MGVHFEWHSVARGSINWSYGSLWKGIECHAHPQWFLLSHSVGKLGLYDKWWGDLTR